MWEANLLESVVGGVRGTRGCELQAEQRVVVCIQCGLAVSYCTCKSPHSSSRLLAFAFLCKTRARQA